MKINLNDGNSPNSSSKLKKNHERKIRSLVKKKDVITLPKRKDLPRLRIIFIPALLLSISVLFYQISQLKPCEFWSVYERNFNKVVYRDEYYCIRKINSNVILTKLKDEVVNQDDALELIRGSLEFANREGIVRMAFNGDVGTGKSLTASIISQSFQWQGNIQRYSWREEQSNLNPHLSKCGFNLIIIDDLDFNATSINYIKEIEQEFLNKSKNENYRIIFIVIFHGSHEKLKKISNEDEEDMNALQELLKNFVIVDFHSISTLDEFKKCIDVHQNLFNIKISSKDMDDLKKIDYKTTGCKLIEKRLNLFKV